MDEKTLMLQSLRQEYPDADDAMLAILAIRTLMKNTDAGFEMPSGLFVVDYRGKTFYTDIHDEAVLLDEVLEIIVESKKVGKNLFVKRWQPLINEKGVEY